jgi:hypothetical protein
VLFPVISAHLTQKYINISAHSPSPKSTPQSVLPSLLISPFPNSLPQKCTIKPAPFPDCPNKLITPNSVPPSLPTPVFPSSQPQNLPPSLPKPPSQVPHLKVHAQACPATIPKFFTPKVCHQAFALQIPHPKVRHRNGSLPAEKCAAKHVDGQWG